MSHESKAARYAGVKVDLAGAVHFRAVHRRDVGCGNADVDVALLRSRLLPRDRRHTEVEMRGGGDGAGDEVEVVVAPQRDEHARVRLRRDAIHGHLAQARGHGEVVEAVDPRVGQFHHFAHAVPQLEEDVVRGEFPEESTQFCAERVESLRDEQQRASREVERSRLARRGERGEAVQ